jgi:hypothetical protein
VSHTRDILQTFWRDEQLPWLELRSTRQSRQAYKRHRHSQLSLGAIIEGETCCLCNGRISAASRRSDHYPRSSAAQL